MQTVEESRKKILVVEDEGLIADDIRRRLERLGYSVPATASSGEEAIQLARSQCFDLVLMDIRLKGQMDGIAAAQQLRNDLRSPVVYLTAHADQDTVNRATITEPFGYILKPIADGNLRSTVQIALYKHEMERRLRTSEAWLSTTLRSIGDGIVATDANGDIVFMNAVAERLTGWTASDASARALMEVLSLRDELSYEPARNPVFDLAPEESRAYTLVSRNGAGVPVEAECFENCDALELLGAIVVLRDIRARREWEGQLIQSQRMDAIAALAGGMAGHFNAQLTAILAQVDDLYTRLSGEERELSGVIRQSASRAAGLGGQLSALSRRDPLLSETINVNEAIGDLQDSLSLCLGRGITLETMLGSHAAFIRADRNRFQQVLINLALHARDAMPDGGALRIETSILDLDAGDPAYRRYRNRWYARLRFTDTSPGIDAASLAGVFEPSFSVPAGGAGSHFGLSIAHSIVVQGGGHVTASSAIGKGTTFEILWPCIGTYQGVVGLIGRFHQDDPIPAVFLVEEEDALRRSMRCCLEQEGYQVLEAKTATHADLVAAAFRQPIAVLVSEFGAGQPPERLHVSATLHLSGYRHDRLPPDVDVLRKPFPMIEFRRRVRALLERAATPPVGIVP